MQMSEKYFSKELAEKAAKRGYSRALNVYEAEDCKLTTEANAFVLVHPDRFQGTVTLRYEW